MVHAVPTVLMSNHCYSFWWVMEFSNSAFQFTCRNLNWKVIASKNESWKCDFLTFCLESHEETAWCKQLSIRGCYNPLAFYSQKLNGTQKRYITGEQELLSIMETLKELHSLLLGQKLTMHTNHKNIIDGNLTNDRIIRWRLLLEGALSTVTFQWLKCSPEKEDDILSFIFFHSRW